jgi:hypothetical protein
MKSLTILCLVAFWPQIGAAYEAVPVTDGGHVAGKVTFEGAPPAAAPIKVEKDPDFCGKQGLVDESLLVGADKGLANVVVFLKKVKKGRAAAPMKSKLVNKGCRYEPRVQALTVGSELAVHNADPILHNTHIKLPKSDVFNYGLPKQGQTITRVVDRKGLMKVGCDAGHTWMQGYIAAFDHPYFAVTGPDGAFRIEGIPPGKYKVRFWHESLGKKTKKVEITAGGQVDLSVALK